MMDELKKMMAKKGQPEKMDDSAIQAKLDVIKELLEMAHSAMGNKMKGDMDEMHKVSVMAPDQEGLEEGLDVAHDALEGAEEHEDEDDGVEPKSPIEEAMAAHSEEKEEPPVEIKPDSEDEVNLFAKKRMKQTGKPY